MCVDACPSQTVAVGNTCVESCPMYTSYQCIIEVGSKCGETSNGKLTHAICVNECPLSMLIWNNTCVFSCRSGQKVFGKECTNICPPDSPYEQNITKTEYCTTNDRSCEKVKTMLTCVDFCSSESYIYKHLCLSHCPTHFLYSGRLCVSTCPKTEPYILHSTISIWSYISKSYYYHYSYEKKSEYKYIQRCVAACGTGMVRLNYTCVTSCPNQYAINGNGTCYKGDCGAEYKEVTKVGIVCLDKCKPNTFSLNNTCVDSCTGTNMAFHFNGTCVDKCPQGYNNMAISIKNEVEYYKYWAGDVLLNNCTKYCGDEYFQYNGICINFCKPPLLTFQKTCVEVCPFNATFYVTTSVSFTDISQNGKTFQRNKISKTILKCMVACPNNTVALKTKCVQHCPLNKRFIINGSCQSEECNTKYRFYHSSGIKCYYKCPKELFVSNNTCVVKCLDNEFVFSQKCVNTCPFTHTFIEEKTFPIDRSNCFSNVCDKILIKFRDCIESCPRNTFLYKNECKNICPNKTLTYINKCIDFCPDSHRNVERKDIAINEWVKNQNELILRSVIHTTSECVFQCSEKYPIQFHNTCISDCPHELPYRINNRCVKMCPRYKLIDLKTKHCVDKCAQTYGEFNGSCYTNCPKHIKYIFAAICVSECPSSYPVALEEHRFVCQKSCEDSKLFKDGKCVYSYQCDDPMVEYNGLCLHRCPEGFVWFTHCLNILPAKVAIGILVLLFVLLLLMSGQNMIDFIQTIRLLFISEEMIKEKEKQLINFNLKFKLNGERKDLEDQAELLPNMVDETIL